MLKSELNLPIGIKNLLDTLNESELRQFAKKNLINDDLNNKLLKISILDNFQGKSNLFYQNYVSYIKELLEKDYNNDLIKIEVSKKILYSLSGKNKRKESQVLKEIGDESNYEFCLNFLIKYKLVEKKYRRNENHYTLSIPDGIKNQISFFVGKSEKIDFNIICSKIITILQIGYEKNHIIKLLEKFNTNEKLNKNNAHLELGIEQEINEFTNKDILESLIKKMIEEKIVNEKNKKLGLVEIVKENLPEFIEIIKNYTEEGSINDITEQWKTQFRNIGFQERNIVNYFEEAVEAFNNDLELGSAILLGATSEILMNKVFTKIGNFFGPKMKQEIDNAREIKQKMDKAIKILASVDFNDLEQKMKANGKELQQSQKILLKSEFPTIIRPLFDCYRITRNEIGHPTEMEPDIKLTDVSLLFPAFPTYARQIKALFEIFE